MADILTRLPARSFLTADSRQIRTSPGTASLRRSSTGTVRQMNLDRKGRLPQSVVNFGSMHADQWFVGSLESPETR